MESTYSAGTRFAFRSHFQTVGWLTSHKRAKAVCEPNRSAANVSASRGETFSITTLNNVGYWRVNPQSSLRCDNSGYRLPQMIRGDRVLELMTELDLSQAELARRVGVSQPTIFKLIHENKTGSKHLHQVARELKTSAAYLTGEVDNPQADAQPIPVNDVQDVDTDEVEIDSIDLSYGMGGTFLDSDSIEVEKIKFSRSWLRQFTNSPPNVLFSTRGAGDSMMPTIHDRDVVIVDRSQNSVDMGDKVWAVVFGGVAMIKRLRPMPDGTVKISSDNQLVRDELATDGDLFIVGRVIAKVSSL